MDIKRNGSHPSGKGPAEYFTGTVRIDPLLRINRGTGVSDEQSAVCGRNRTWMKRKSILR